MSTVAVADPGNTDAGNLGVAYTVMANGTASAGVLRINRFDQLGADAGAMWSIAMTSPTINASLGFRTATESGSGRTRSETNRPAATGAAAE